MGVYDVEWGDFMSSGSVGSPASSGSSGNGSSATTPSIPTMTLPDPDPQVSGGMTQAQQDAFQAAQSMAAAGVTGLGGGQQQPGAQGSFTLTDPSTGQTNTYTTNNQGTTFTTNQAGQTTHINGAPIEPSGIFGAGLTGGQNLLSQLSPLAGVLKGSQSTDRFFKNLASGEELTPEDKIILANLIAADKRNPKVFGDLGKYLEEYDVSEEFLRGRLDEEVELFEGESLERVEELIENYLAGKPTGLDSLTSMIGDFTGSADKKWNIYEDENWRGDPTTEYGVTLEQLKEQIKPEGMAYLKANRPDLYYSFTDPQTTGSLEELAALDAASNPDIAQMIFNARNELDKQTGGQGGGQGIADLSPVAQLAATTTPEEVAAATVPAEVAAATTTPAATTTAATEPIPIDYPGPHFTSAYPGHYANLGSAYANLGPDYVNQGLGQWPNFDYWNQIANAFPGMSQYG